jgi:hypothetical protein
MVQEPEPPDAQLEPPTASEIETLELFRRSPHPYHRRRYEVGSLQRCAESSSNDFLRTTLQPSNRASEEEDSRNSRKQPQSPSESGTEADDEGYSFIKALPAPPLRLHKGLRGGGRTDGNGEATPLLTPSQVDEEGRKLSAEYFRPRKERSRSGEPSPTDAEAKAARQKYLKRRRNEVVRRTTETALLGAIGILSVTGCGYWEQLLQRHRGGSMVRNEQMAGC